MQKMREEMQARMRAPRPPEVQSRALSHDGKIAVSYSSTGSVTLWDAITGKDLRTLLAYDATSHLLSSTRTTFSPNNQLIFTLGQIKQKVEPGAIAQISNSGVNETIQGKLWDVKTGQLLWTLPEMNDGVKWSTAVNTAAFSPDGKLLATKARYGPIHLWDTGTGKLMRTLTVPFINMDALAFSPDGKTLAGGGYHFPSYSSEILLWDVASGELERSLKHPDNALGTQITTIAFSPNGKLLATGGGVGKYEKINEASGRFNARYGAAQLWDVKSGVLLTTVGRPVHRNLVTALTFSPDGARIATGSLDQTVGLWDTRRGMLQGSATFYGSRTENLAPEAKAPEGEKAKPTGIGVQDLAFSSNGQVLNILSNNKAARAWDVASPSPQSDPIRRVIPGSNAAYASFAFAPNGQGLVSGDHDKKVRFWKMDNQEETESFIAHSDAVTQVALAPLAPDEPAYSRKPPLLATASRLMKWTKTGPNSGAGYTTGFEVKLWNSQSHELQRTLTVPELTLTSLAISPGGEWVAAAGGKVGPLPQGSVTQGAVAGNDGAGVGVGVFIGGPANPNEPADMREEVTGVVMLWNATTGELKQKFTVVDEIPSDIAFSADGSLLASDGNRAGVAIWRTATGEAVASFDEDRLPPLKPGHRRVVTYGTPVSKTTLAFTPDGARLARSRKGDVKLWDVQTGALISTLTDPEAPQNSETDLMALTPDGKTLATAGSFQPLKLWDVTNGKILWKSTEKTPVSMIEMAPNGKTLATGGGGEIRLWNITQAAQGIVK